MSHAADNEAQKKAIYERMSPRRRKFVDRIGYDNWDPFAEPNHPVDIRTDVTRMTTQQMLKAFFHSLPEGRFNTDYAKGAHETAFGLVNRQERQLGAYDFVRWYLDLLEMEGIAPEEISRKI
jgi:hypothetical protein